MEAMRKDFIIKRQEKDVQNRSEQKNFKKQMGLIPFKMRLKQLCGNRDLEGMECDYMILTTSNLKGNNN